MLCSNALWRLLLLPLFLLLWRLCSSNELQTRDQLCFRMIDALNTGQAIA